MSDAPVIKFTMRGAGPRQHALATGVDSMNESRLRARRAGAQTGYGPLRVVGLVAIVGVVLASGCASTHPPATTTSAAPTSPVQTLASARTQASALYQSGNQSFAPAVVAAFNESAPEFRWTSGACTDPSSNCVSYFVGDLETPGDAQQLILAVAGPSKTCWYLMDNEMTPTLLQYEAGGDTAGVFYSKAQDNGGCSGGDPATDTTWMWSTNPYEPGLN